MMNKRFLLFCMVMISVMILVSGCWNYAELDRIAIVSGLAVDKNPKGDKFLLTAEIVDIQGSLTEEHVKARRIQAEGDTIFDAVRNMILISAKKLYWSHTKAIIVSQDVAKEGIRPVIDWVCRDIEPRADMGIFVSREKTAWELLEQQSITTDIRAFEMEYMLIANTDLSKSVRIDIIELIDTIAGKGTSSYLPAIGVTLNDGRMTANLSGIAVLKKDKFIEFLSEQDAKFFLFVRNKIRGGLLIISPDEEQPKDRITLEIFKSKTKIQPVYSNGKLLMKININTEVGIAEEDAPINYMIEKNKNKLKKETEEYLNKNIENIIKKVQENFDTDIFGFGRIVMEKMPSLWKNIDDEWDEVFKTLEVDINTEIDIRGSGLISKPIQVGD
ncbi:Ger(x)C family spore germination protein [Alkaliphilus sp. B6464]|uniref:Ger(x)C family spore germination protein n=1 Tax=Alkaliphilus sp. B6464 TaxID=2731219 RepID=UPI001BA6C4F8|nr:Ger(x)C family spore germination protein [Alkaliphilus sp. B6464]QUH19235.1 Ger(x)C family spore germination protein [Alkaliphilus sp. B6464]